MSFLRNYLNQIKPNFEEGGKLHAFRSVFDGFETFLYVPNTTAKSGASIHDAIDSKRIMSMVVIALLPALLFGMYNVGYQNYLAAGQDGSFLDMFIYGALAVVPKILVSYIVGLGIEFAWAQWKNEEIQEGYLVDTELLLLVDVASDDCLDEILSVDIHRKHAVILTTHNHVRAFLFFSYPTKMSGDTVWVSTESILGFGNTLPDGFTCATPLGQMATGNAPTASLMDSFIGLIPGSIGETSVIAIAIGAIILLWTGIASWKTMFSVFAGGALLGYIFQATGQSTVEWYHQFAIGGFCFGAVFMATDPVTSARTETGKYIYGFIIGALAVIIRQMNPGFPEGMMLAILFGNMMAPTIDYFVVQRNINKRLNRVKK